MGEHTNGHTAEALPGGVIRGRIPPSFPSITLPSSGYTVQCRRLSPDTMPRCRAQALVELEPEKPRPPRQFVEVGPGERPGDPARVEEVERTNDPDYERAVANWTLRMLEAAGRKFARIVQDYAVVTPTDAAEVADWRAAQAAVGIDTGHLSDREVWLWEIVAPRGEDQQALMGFVQGLNEAQQEAARAAGATFRDQLSRQTIGRVGQSERPGEL